MLTALEVPLPADATEVVAGDADGDGRDDLVVVSEVRDGAGPARIRLTVIRFDGAGRLAGTSTLDLGANPLLWELDHGLWALDREGIVRLDVAGGPPRRVARVPTILTPLGPATPRRGEVAEDLDGDGQPELLAWSAGRWLAFRADGTSLGGAPAPARGILDSDRRAGASALTAAVAPPPLVVADIDGDGKPDLLLPARDRVAVYFGGGTLGARSTTLRLPLDLEPDDSAPLRDGETRKEVADAWFEDLDGDGRADLVVQRIVLNGSWFGASTELLTARGTGTGFEPPRTLTTGAAAFDVRLLDVDGDGDLDFLAPMVDLGVTNLARALVSREMRVDLGLYRQKAGSFPAEPTALHALAFPVEAPDRLQAELAADLDGDGRLDLVTNDGHDHIRVFRGVEGGLAPQASWERDVDVPRGRDSLMVHDLTGDRRAEVVIWGRDRRTLSVLRLP